MRSTRFAAFAAALLLLGAGCHRAPAAQSVPPVTYSPDPMTLKGQPWVWQVTDADGTATVPRQRYAFSVTFGDDGKVTGTTDCNSFFGTYEAGADGTLTFLGPFGMTKKFCADAQEDDFMRQLGAATSFGIDADHRALSLKGDGMSMLFVPLPAVTAERPVAVWPVSHASFALTWDDMTVYNDPTSAPAFGGLPPADLILVGHAHGDHFNADALGALLGPDAALVVPKAVADQLPTALLTNATVLANGESAQLKGFTVTAVPSYNLPAEGARHPKGEGNGYVLEKDGYRAYVAGDTSGTPEMRALAGIDLAFVPMNPPYTMSVEEAADAVLAFAPTVVYPYHYRGQDGLNDTAEFARLVAAGGKGIDVELANWYPGQ